MFQRIGTDGIDVLGGTPRADIIYGDPYTVGSQYEIEEVGSILVEGSGFLGLGIGGFDLIDGFSGKDTLVGDAAEIGETGAGGWDIIHGGNGVDLIAGDADRVFGEGGNDIIKGGKGGDGLFGDAFDAFGGNANGGDDVITGGRGKDFIIGDGGLMFGNAEGGDDRLYGGRGNDTVSGDGISLNEGATGGDDFISGGRGNDHPYGDAFNAEFLAENEFAGGFDTFYFGDKSGQDFIYDFEIGKDTIVIGGYDAVETFADLDIAETDGNTIIDLGASNGMAAGRHTVTVLDATGLTAADVAFDLFA
ncbi:MAG: hypothetical protein AAGD34_04225 [Pseudomonadota bacterium]